MIGLIGTVNCSIEGKPGHWMILYVHLSLSHRVSDLDDISHKSCIMFSSRRNHDAYDYRIAVSFVGSSLVYSFSLSHTSAFESQGITVL